MLPPPPPPRQSFPDGDAAIRSTDDDAAHARVSAVRKGYLKDPYIQYLVPRSHLIPTRPPLINVGTYIRSEVIDKLMAKWLDSLEESSQAQIDPPARGKVIKWIEIDFAEAVAKKALAIRKHSALSEAVGPDLAIEKGGTVLRSSVFNMLAVDLRGEASKALQPLEALLSTEQPILLLAEWDTFGRMMRENLKVRRKWALLSLELIPHLKIRNIDLPGVDDSSIKQTLESHLRNVGLGLASSMTLKEARNSCFPDVELERLSRLELLDEIEELDLVLGHYVVTWGSTNVTPDIWKLNPG
ncbi:carboxy methyl transferase for protein phosphatase 2A [Tulasnella sp. 417]|nr:carboxy methyl transferase for protein phosphatase 2A [Tulasnella sp. 417]